MQCVRLQFSRVVARSQKELNGPRSAGLRKASLQRAPKLLITAFAGTVSLNANLNRFYAAKQAERYNPLFLNTFKKKTDATVMRL